jgi:hypothetical protein
MASVTKLLAKNELILMRKGRVPCFRVEEVCSDAKNDEHSDKHDVIFPTDAL